ncbi:hypothetical protein BALS_19735, partial [Bacillus altitudinis]|uniref:hypothetical protein n=1 Tax=Bacillus altitudinis TaxID=293387 RepID=UPI001FACBFDA
AALLLVSIPVGFVSIALGLKFDGRDPLTIQCLRGPYPDEGGPYYEATRAVGEVSLLPLGVDCTYDVDGDDVAAQTNHHYDYPATAGLIVGAMAFGSGVLLVIVRD